MDDRAKPASKGTVVISLAIVGYGYWGPNIVRIVRQTDHATLKICCDSNPQQLAVLSRKHPDVSTTLDFQDVLDDPAIQAVILATPISTHHALAKQALLHGKHVLVEKPMTDRLEDAVELNELASVNRLTLMVNHTFLYSPPIIKIREIIQSGELGKVFFINMMRVNLGMHSSRSNVIWDLGAHDLSILSYWLNEQPSEIQAFGRDCIAKGVHDVAYLNMRFPSGPVVNVNVSWLSPSKYRNTIIVGSRKMLVFDDTRNEEKIKIYDRGIDVKPPDSFGEFQLTYRTGDIVIPALESKEPLSDMIAHFIDCVMHHKKPRSDGQNGLDVVRTLHFAMKSLRENSGVQYLSDPWLAASESAMKVI